MESTKISVTFLGVSTLLFTDGETSLLTDGFFTRPAHPAFHKLAPDGERISRGLSRAGIDRLDAVLVVHSHYDHALDAPEVARRTGAVLVGSSSSVNVGRGGGLPEERLRTVTVGEPMTFGQFRVTYLPGKHGFPCLFHGEINAPLTPPAWLFSYKEGGSFAVLIEHPLGSALVNASASFIPGALAGRRADVVMLGIAMLGLRGLGFRERYFQELVKDTGAARVYPVHWDRFDLPLEPPLEMLSGRTEAGRRWLQARAEAEGVTYGELPVLEPITLFPAAR